MEFLTRYKHICLILVACFYIDAVSAKAQIGTQPDIPSKLTLITLKKQFRFEAKDLAKKLVTKTLKHHSPIYDKPMEYQGYDFLEVMALFGIQKDQLSNIRFTCRDGFQPILNLKEIPIQLFLATGETDGKWDPIPEGKELHNPAPFFIMSKNPGDFKKWPWPHQVITIEILPEDKGSDSLLFPKGASANSRIFQGFKTYKHYCASCHSINLEGGDIGPELNIPQNITEYRSEKYILQFVKNPESFRARSRMMAFPFLKDAQIEDIIQYLRHMKKLKKT